MAIVATLLDLCVFWTGAVVDVLGQVAPVFRCVCLYVCVCAGVDFSEVSARLCFEVVSKLYPSGRPLIRAGGAAYASGGPHILIQRATACASGGPLMLAAGRIS